MTQEPDKPENTNQSASISASREVSNSVSPVLNSATRLLQRLIEGEVSSYKQSKRFIHPFSINEEFLRNLDGEVNEKMDVSEPRQMKPYFEAEVRFTDLSTIKFIDFSRFLRKAGNTKEPESIWLSWDKFFIDSDGTPFSSKVNITFSTEKKMEDDNNAIGEYYRASTLLSVSGSDDRWVEETFGKLVPFVEATKLAGIYRPLWVFRNPFVVQVTSQVLSWMGFFVGFNLAEQMFFKSTQLSDAELVKKIVDTSDVSEKINILADRLLHPIRQVWWQPIIAMACAALTYILVLMVGQNLLPRLTPNSVVSVGLSSKKAQDYINVFRFLVFTVLISGVVIPVLIEVVKYLL